MNELSKETLLQSSLWGVARGWAVSGIIYPFEVIKIRQQCAETSARIAWTILRQEGPLAFYAGFSSELGKTASKFWCWPMITGVPALLKPYQLGDLTEQSLTGASIATLNAAVFTPIERRKVQAAATGKSVYSLKNAYKDGWRGGFTHWSKLSINWVTFLVAQKELRNRAYAREQRPPTLFELAKMGTQVALIVSIVSAPFDMANTLNLAQGISPSQLFARARIRTLFRGLPLSLFSRVVQNIASIITINQLAKPRHTLINISNTEAKGECQRRCPMAKHPHSEPHGY